jgi:RNA polymerase sigma-70 factor (ECF subfamily)
MITTQAASRNESTTECGVAWEYHGADRPQLLGWDDLVVHREYLVRFAKSKLQTPALAEDIVHDVFEAVMSGKASFSGKSALRSWLTGILKHKIIDTIRLRARYDSLDAEDGDDRASEMVCGQAGPEGQVQNREALRHVLKRIEGLPAALRDVMQFRVLQDESCEDVCERLQITESSLFVRLHRARKQLLC